MNDQAIADLKQFISTTVYQHTVGLSEDMKSVKVNIRRLDRKIDQLDERTDALSLEVGDALAANAKSPNYLF